MMKQYDLVGIGVGPFNLSLAALLSTVDDIESIFFDRNREFNWHPGMMLPEASIQVSHLYDLVTLVDPTNKFSFLSYLSEQNRLYQFANANFPRILRKEFSHYYAWVSRKLNNVHFNQEVKDVSYHNKVFTIATGNKSVLARHIAVGVGLVPYVPEFAKPHLGNNIYHCADFQSHPRQWLGKRMLIVGGGQSGAEVVRHVLSNDHHLPAEITWLSRRGAFLPMDESSFAYEIYTPEHTTSFYQQSVLQKQQLLKDHLLSSDGISPELLDNIYRRIYQLKYVDKENIKITLLPKHQLTNISLDNRFAEINNLYTNHNREAAFDIIIFCTGYHWQYPEFMNTLKNQIRFYTDGKYIVGENYAINWTHDKTNSIFVHNAARHTYGVQDPNLCLSAWRSATIINSITRRLAYRLPLDNCLINWNTIYNETEVGMNHAAAY